MNAIEADKRPRTYAELEADNDDLRHEVADLRTRLRGVRAAAADD